MKTTVAKLFCSLLVFTATAYALGGQGGGYCPGDAYSCIITYCQPGYARCIERCPSTASGSPTADCENACDYNERSCEAGCANVTGCSYSPQ